MHERKATIVARLPRKPARMIRTRKRNMEKAASSMSGSAILSSLPIPDHNLEVVKID